MAAAGFGAVPLVVFGLAAAPGAGRVAGGPGAAASRTAAAARGPAVPVNFDVSQRPGNEAENTIAVNPTDPRNVAAMACGVSATNGGLFLGVSFDGGRTWTRRLFATAAQVGHTCDEDLAWDRYGNLWMSHLTGTGKVFIGVSTDGGRHFAKVTYIVPAGRPISRPAADQPYLAVGPGSVWVSYASTPSGVIQAAGARVTGRGRFGHFSRPQNVPNPHGQGDASGLAIGPHGQVLVTYETLARRCCARIYTALDPDGLGPKGFGSPRPLARTRVNYGFDFIPAQPDRGIDAEPELAWDTGPGRYHGRLYAVWSQAAPHNHDDLTVMFSDSGNSGATWAKATPLNGPQTVDSQFFQSIAVDQATGDIAVGWYDCRNAHGHGGQGCRRPDSYTQFWATYSTNGGRSFAADFPVSRGTSNAKDTHSFFDYGDYTQVAFQSHRFYPAWSDNSDSTGTNPDGTLHQVDLYTALVHIP